ncbi:hypothetical protein ACEYW6_31565 [Nostoc sp. UIC 10607]
MTHFKPTKLNRERYLPLPQILSGANPPIAGRGRHSESVRLEVKSCLGYCWVKQRRQIRVKLDILK